MSNVVQYFGTYLLAGYISHEQSSSSHGRYPLWLAVLCCSELHSMSDSKAAQMNIQNNLNQELFFNWAIMPQNQPRIYVVLKVKMQLISTVTKRLKKFCLDSKNLNDQAESGWPKTEDPKPMLQIIE